MVFKIHGDVSVPESIVITDEDYIQFVLRMSSKEPYDPVPLTLKYYLTRWTTLFVGYSLLDYNLRLLFKTLRWKVDVARLPDMYSVDYEPDPLIVDVWHNQRRYINFIAQDVWAFVPRLPSSTRPRQGVRAIATLAQKPVTVPSAPYRGIREFRFVDSAIFFARTVETERLLRLVTVYRGVMLYMESGSGKSSLVNAGVLPLAVDQGLSPERVRVQPREEEELVVERDHR